MIRHVFVSLTMRISDDDADDVKTKCVTPANTAKSSSTNAASTADSAASDDCILVHGLQWSFVAWLVLDLPYELIHTLLYHISEMVISLDGSTGANLVKPAGIPSRVAI